MKHTNLLKSLGAAILGVVTFSTLLVFVRNKELLDVSRVDKFTLISIYVFCFVRAIMYHRKDRADKRRCKITRGSVTPLQEVLLQLEKMQHKINTSTGETKEEAQREFDALLTEGLSTFPEMASDMISKDLVFSIDVSAEAGISTEYIGRCVLPVVTEIARSMQSSVKVAVNKSLLPATEGDVFIIVQSLRDVSVSQMLELNIQGERYDR